MEKSGCFYYPDGIYLSKVKHENSRTICKICSKITVRTPEQRNCRHSGVFNVNFEQIHLLIRCFHCYFVQVYASWYISYKVFLSSFHLFPWWYSETTKLTFHSVFITNTAWKMSVFSVFLIRIFPQFGLNMERYSLSLRIQSECGKIRTSKTPNTDIFYVVQRITDLPSYPFRTSV